MDPLYLALAFGTMAGVGVFMAVWSLRPAHASSAEVMERRVRAYESAMPMAQIEPELQKPFIERVIRPAIRRIGRLLEQAMPAHEREKIYMRLQAAARQNKLTPGDFIAWRYVITGLLCAAGIGVGLLVGGGIAIALGAALGAAFGLFLPNLWLSRMVNARRLEIQYELPDTADVLVVCVEAGLTFEAAMEKVVDKFDSALAEELGRVLYETRLGRPRLLALQDMANRCGVEDLNNFVQAIVQSEQLGAGLVRLLSIQAEDLRGRRLARAEERGAKAPLKMLLPMVGCIFPTLWVVLLGPAALLAIKFLLGR